MQPYKTIFDLYASKTQFGTMVKKDKFISSGMFPLVESVKKAFLYTLSKIYNILSLFCSHNSSLTKGHVRLH